MRTTLNLSEALVERARRALKAKTKTETIVRSLEETIRRQDLQQLRLLRGRLPLTIDLGKARARA